MIRFGPSGNSEAFYEQGFKSSLEAPEWIAGMGLSAYEYQCSKGINISPEKAVVLGQKAKEHNIFLSIHAPYFINLSSIDEVKKQNSIKYVLDTLAVAKLMGAKRVVVHPGSCAGIDRCGAFNAARKTLENIVDEAANMGLDEINICPETMGKINQLGDVEEIIELCTINERIIPTLDFGHLYARSRGKVNSCEDYEKIFDNIKNKLGQEKLKHFHCHFSRIEFTQGGEKKHWTLEDTQFGPEFIFLARVIARCNLEPVIISESRGTMAEDALKLKKIYDTEKEKIVL
ncbi:MAG: TIM barrel protein [Deltaproteobacteria bacterium]